MSQKGGVVALLAVLGALVAARFVVPGRHRKLFEEEGARASVDPDLLHALQLRENPREDPSAIGAVNSNGTRDYGLMQINSTNFERLGLGTVSSGAWRDARKNVRAAAQLLAEQMRDAPHLGVADHMSVYNAGFSTQTKRGEPLRPKRARDGGYFNADYVRAAFAWYVLIKLAAAVPFKTLGWEA